jgi:hypothetical protein
MVRQRAFTHEGRYMLQQRPVRVERSVDGGETLPGDRAGGQLKAAEVLW